MMIYADLHTHTDFSDGVDTIDDLLCNAKSKGIKKLAVTDHDTVFHLPIVFKKALQYDIQIISGVELSLFDYNVNLRVHLLGLFFPEVVPEKLDKHVQEVNQRRDNFHRILIERFNKSGYPLSYDDVKRYAKNNIPYKMHIFLALYDKYLKEYSNNELKAFYMDHFGKPQSKEDDILLGYPTVETGINWVLESGGVPIIAHPNLYHSFDRIEDYIAMGLQGIECFHSQMKAEDTKRALEIVEKHHLYITGGSDYHGDIYGVKDQTLGNYGLSKEYWDKLQTKLSQKART